jgi:hypothetical protein
MGEIRTLIKSDTGTIGEEVKAERQRQDLASEEGRLVR